MRYLYCDNDNVHNICDCYQVLALADDVVSLLYFLFIWFSFSDYEQATFRQYQRLTKQLKPDLEAYERQKEEL